MNRSPQLHELLRRWRAAEERADSEAADAALLAAFRELPLERPSPGFAERVLTRTPAAAAAPAAVRTAGSGALAAALWLVVASVTTMALARLAVVHLPRPGLADGVRVFTNVFTAVWEWLLSGIVLWDRLASWGESVRELVLVPQVSLTLLAATLLAVIAFRLLRDLISRDASWSHADVR